MNATVEASLHPDDTVWAFRDHGGSVLLYVGHPDEPRPLTASWEDLTGIRIGTVDAERPTVMIVEVGGAEARLLAHADDVLKVHKPLLWVRIDPAAMRDQFGDLASWLHRHLAGLGYVPEMVDDDEPGDLYRWYHPDGIRR